MTQANTEVMYITVDEQDDGFRSAREFHGYMKEDPARPRRCDERDHETGFRQRQGPVDTRGRHLDHPLRSDAYLSQLAIRQVHFAAAPPRVDSDMRLSA